MTDYVRQEFNRAESLENGGRRGTVGFALTILQRRLASSPEAIYQSLQRRRERLERRLLETEQAARGLTVELSGYASSPDVILSEEDIDDLEDAPAAELEALEETIIDQATSARTVAELRLEIEILTQLESRAQAVRVSGLDRKWEELSRLLQDDQANV